MLTSLTRTTLRELLQNAADALATKVTVKFETLPSSTVPVPQTSEKSVLLRHTLLHHTLKRLLVTNDGQPFGPTDWSRLKSIAEGNPDETKIGAFGVGFYSVFADCEEPFVSSGKEAMAFFWRENSLFTKHLQLSDHQNKADTTFVLDYRNLTSSMPALLPLCQFLASSLTFVNLSEVELWLDNNRLFKVNKLTTSHENIQIPKGLQTRTLERLMHVNSVVREMVQLDARWLNIIAWKPSAVSYGNSSQTVKSIHSSQSLRSFFSRFASGANTVAAEQAASQERAAQEAISRNLVGESTSTVFLHVNTATVHTNVSPSFAQELERATKKPPPQSTKVAVLTTSHDETLASTSTPGAASPDIFSTVLPTRSGRIFIGFPTYQTTGLKAHISASSIIPTVERESIDLNARWVRTWNMEMLRAAGIVCRLAWSGEINTISRKLSPALIESNETRQMEVDKMIPAATHILNQFTFDESTPSSMVGTLVEEAFWTCDESASIELLSSVGVLPSHQVRLASEDLSFVDRIPMIPASLVEGASGFIRKLADYGLISDITTTDIKKELEARALTQTQLVEFLRWIGPKAQRKDVDASVIRSLLNSAVANDLDANPPRLIQLADIKSFIIPTKYPPHIPAPPNTLPHKFTKANTQLELEALGWEELQVVPWLQWLVENTGGKKELPTEQDITHSVSFTSQVLPILSKQWEGLSQSSKSCIVELLTPRTVIPTKLGLKKPAEAYFPSVRIFDDLPVIQNLPSVKEKFLIVLGVRKTVELRLVFDRLMAPPNYTEDAAKAQRAWSHVDLIKYLASVQQDIPKSDVKTLKATPICPAEVDVAGSVETRYRAGDLLEPNEVHRSLGLRLLQWPGVYRPRSEEGRFLTFLGLKAHPTVAQLIEIAARAATTNDPTLRDRALKYFVDAHHQNSYLITDSANTNIPFLPLEAKDPKTVALPTDCFTNDQATILGFRILRRDLHPHASKFGVRANPPILDCVDRLLKNPPDNKRQAREVFEYMATRLGELGGRPGELLHQAAFIPISGRISTVPVRSTPSKNQPVRFLLPRVCFLGDGSKYEGVFDYIDFGTVANSFLLKCGAKHEPTTVELVQQMIREPMKILTIFGVAKYLDLLKTIAIAWPNLKHSTGTVRSMKQASFLLGYKQAATSSSRVSWQHKSQEGTDTYDIDDSNEIQQAELAVASQVIIVDDVFSYNLFKDRLLVSPQDDDLDAFYLALGAISLASIVERRNNIGRPFEDQSSGVKLRQLIQERVKLFLHDTPTDHIRKDAGTRIEKKLVVTVVQTLEIRRSLRGQNVHHNQSISALQTLDSATQKHTLYITPGRVDSYHVSQALMDILSTRPKPHQVLVLTMMLDTDLYTLRSRGYNVQRILRQRAAEARVAEELQKKHLAEEQQRMNEQMALSVATHNQDGKGSKPKAVMPGVFPESLDQATRDQVGGRHANTRENSTDSPTVPPPPYPYAEILQNGAEGQRGQVPNRTVSTPPTALDPHNLAHTLTSAINSSQAHSSKNLVSKNVVNNVRESQTFCDMRPAHNIIFCAVLRSSLKVFLTKSIVDKQGFMAKAATGLDHFASILLVCADAVTVQTSSIHIFHDPSASTIAFNQNHALFFNYSVFEKLHLPKLLLGGVEYQTARQKGIIYWFVILCHELAHNIVEDHSAAHSYYL